MFVSEHGSYLFSPVMFLDAWLANSRPESSSGMSLLMKGCGRRGHDQEEEVRMSGRPGGARAGCHLHDDRPVDEDGVGHVQADWQDGILQELDEAAAGLDGHRGVPGGCHDVRVSWCHDVRVSWCYDVRVS